MGELQTSHLTEGRGWAVAHGHRGVSVYVAGPMRGMPGHGYKPFHRAEARLWDLGLVPLSPARGGPPLDHVAMTERRYGDIRLSPLYATMMRKALAMVLQARAVFMLPGWENSRGATLEHQVAQTVGCEIFDGAWLIA